MALDDDDAVLLRFFEFYPAKKIAGHFERVVFPRGATPVFSEDEKERPLLTRGLFKDTEYEDAMCVLESARNTAQDTYDESLAQGKKHEEATRAGYRAGYARLLSAPNLIYITTSRYRSS